MQSPRVKPKGDDRGRAKWRPTHDVIPASSQDPSRDRRLAARWSCLQQQPPPNLPLIGGGADRACDTNPVSPPICSSPFQGEARWGPSSNPQISPPFPPTSPSMPFSPPSPTQSLVMTSDARGDSWRSRGRPACARSRQPDLKHWCRLNRLATRPSVVARLLPQHTKTFHEATASPPLLTLITAPGAALRHVPFFGHPPVTLLHRSPYAMGYGNPRSFLSLEARAHEHCAEP